MYFKTLLAVSGENWKQWQICFLGSKIIALSDCSYDMKRLLLLEEELWQI